MKRLLAMLILMLAAAGCVSMFDSTVVPMNMPVSQAVTSIEVTPRGEGRPANTIKNRKQIEAAMQALEGEHKKWYRPTPFPKEEYTLVFESRGGHSRTLMLGDGWFGGFSGETRILRWLDKEEESEIRMLLGLAPKDARK